MMMAARIIVDLLIIFGCYFVFAGVVGILRMPDVFCRLHSCTSIATFGMLGIVLGTSLWTLLNGNIAMGIKILLIGVFIILTYPISGHAICKGAYKSSSKPHREMVCDDYGRDCIDE